MTEHGDSDSDSEVITPEYLESLLQKARQAATANAKKTLQEDAVLQEEEVIRLSPELLQTYVIVYFPFTPNAGVT
jgi:hypothetical protein